MFNNNDRILLLVAHPDDETIGFGGHIFQCPNLYMVHLTEGSPENLQYALNCGCGSKMEYAELRMNELERALTLCNFDFSHYYNTKTNDQGVVYAIEKVMGEVLHLIKKIRPTILLTHPYEGGHPDHDCAAFIAQKVVEVLSENTMLSNVRRLEFTCYHGKNGYLETGNFPDRSQNMMTIQLTPGQRQIKEKMFKCYHSQKEMLSMFCTDKETFREAPVYSFQTPPHEGKLLYENMNMGIESQNWRAIVNSIIIKCK
jgi:LmbE family N-acetylglucosaminyl deacetylase